MLGSTKDLDYVVFELNIPKPEWEKFKADEVAGFGAAPASSSPAWIVKATGYPELDVEGEHPHDIPLRDSDHVVRYMVVFTTQHKPMKLELLVHNLGEQTRIMSSMHSMQRTPAYKELLAHGQGAVPVLLSALDAELAVIPVMALLSEITCAEPGCYPPTLA